MDFQRTSDLRSPSETVADLDLMTEVEHLLETYSTHELRILMKDMAALQEKPLTYEPHPKQKAFHESTKMITIACAGNRGGKSEAGIQELYWRLTGTHPYKKTRVPIKAWVAGSTFKQVGKVLWKKLKNKLEPRLIAKIKKNSEGYIDYLELINGSTVDFKTYKQDSMDWESEDFDFLLADEPPPREHFISARRGLIDRDGDIVITATPLREPWIYEEIWEPGTSGRDKNISCHQWSSYDNPHVNHAAIRDMERRLTPEEREVRIHGRFKKLIGRVLKHFQPDGKMVVPAFSWPRGWGYFEAIDPHMSKPHGFVRIGITPKRNLVLFHASRPEGTMEQLAAHIIKTRPNNEPPIIDPIVDTSVNQFDNSVGMTQYEQLEAAGINCIMANKRDNVLPGLEEMNRLFYAAEQGLPNALYVMDNCGLFIDEAKVLRWDEKRDDTPKGDDDLIDPARYILINRPLEVSQTGVWKRQRPISYSQQATVKETDKRKYSNRAFDYDIEDDEHDNGQPFYISLSRGGVRY